jgi:hypothetical protein
MRAAVLLGETGAPMKVQQELMRHARHPNNNEYLRQSDGAEQVRRAHRVVRLVLPAVVA